MLSSIQARILLYCAVALVMVDTSSNPGVHRAKQLLLKWEVTLEETNNIASELTGRFLLSGDLQLGTMAIYLKKKCLIEGRMWERYVDLLHIPAGNETSSSFSEQYSYLTGIHKSKEILNEYNELVNIYTLAEILNITYETVGSESNAPTFYTNTCIIFAKKLELIHTNISNIDFYEVMYLNMDQKETTEGNHNITMNDTSKLSLKENSNVIQGEKVKMFLHHLNTLLSPCQNSTFDQSILITNSSDENYRMKDNSINLNDIYRESAKLLFQMWESYNISIGKTFPWPEYLNRLEQLTRNSGENIENSHEIFQYYVYPAVFCFVFITGIIGNGILLLIFIRNKEYRTVPNTMLMNLAIADTLNLLINTPLYYVVKYHCHVICADQNVCLIYLVYRELNYFVIEISILCLSAQRYCATASVLKSISQPSCRISKRVKASLYITSIWITSLIMSVPPILIYEFKPGDCFPTAKQEDIGYALDLLYCLFDALFLPLFIGTFNTLTARLLRRSVQEMPSILSNNPQLIARYRSARIVIALAVAFGVCFIPRSLWFFLASICRWNVHSFNFILVDEITLYLMFFNSCLNPIALYYGSNNFRNLINQYIFGCSRSKHRNVERSVSLETRTTTIS